MSDYIIRATAANNQVRAFVATTKELVDKARELHKTTPVATAALGRLMTAASIMGSMLKNDKDLMTLQIKGDGPIGGITVTVDSKANVKGYVRNSDVNIPLKVNGKLDVSGAIGQGTMQIIKDIGLKDPYTGQINLVSGEIAEDLTYYFASSEQVPSIVALGVLVDRDYSVKQSGGIIIQLLPGADEEIIAMLENNLKKVTSITKMLEEGKSPKEILDIFLEGMEIEILEKIDTQFKCNCSKEKVEKALISIGRKDIQEIIEENEVAELKCHFCSKNYHFTIKEMQDILKRL